MSSRSGAADAIDRSLGRLRWLVVLAVAIVALGSGEFGPATTVAAVAGAVAILTASFGERLVRPWIGIGRASAAVVAIDTTVVVGVLAVHGVAPDDPLALLVVVPLLGAGVRHGLRGLVVGWLGVGAAVIGSSTTIWDVTVSGIGPPARFLGIVLLVALPAANLSEHLVRRVEDDARARAIAERRAELLEAVLRGGRAVRSAEPDEAVATLSAVAAHVTGRDAAVVSGWYVECSPLARRAIAAGGRTVVDEAGRTATSLAGGDRVLLTTVDHADDQLAVDAIELLCAEVGLPHRTPMPADGPERVDGPTIELVRPVVADECVGRPVAVPA